jgi:hypothetical protein
MQGDSGKYSLLILAAMLSRLLSKNTSGFYKWLTNEAHNSYYPEKR